MYIQACARLTRRAVGYCANEALSLQREFDLENLFSPSIFFNIKMYIIRFIYSLLKTYQLK